MKHLFLILLTTMCVSTAWAQPSSVTPILSLTLDNQKATAALCEIYSDRVRRLVRTPLEERIVERPLTIKPGALALLMEDIDSINGLDEREFKPNPSYTFYRIQAGRENGKPLLVAEYLRRNDLTYLVKKANFAVDLIAFDRIMAVVASTCEVTIPDLILFGPDDDGPGCIGNCGGG